MSEVIFFRSLEDIIEYDWRNNTTKTLLIKNFTSTFDETAKKIIKSEFRFNDFLNLTKDNNPHGLELKEQTTIGRYIANLFLFPPVYFEKYGYENVALDKSNYNRITGNVNDLMLNNHIDSRDFADYNDRLMWLGNTLTSISGNSFDSKSLVLHPKVEEKLKQFLSSPKEKLIDPKYVQDNEREIISLVEKYMGDQGLVDIIKSGSKGNFSNNFKNLALFRGIVDGEFIPNDLANGNDINAYMKLGKNAVEGSAARALHTANGGYSSKLLANAYNSLELGEDDCGTKEYLIVNSMDRPQLFNLRYVKLFNDRKAKFEVMKPELHSKYKNKKVLVRSPLYCKSDNICGKCFGDLHKYNGIKKNLSVYTTSLSADIMNKSMKAFHDLTSKYTEINFREIIFDKK